MSEALLPRVLLFAGLVAWVGAAAAAVLTARSYPLFPIWALFSLIFLAAFAWNTRATSPSLSAIGAQSSSVIMMVATLCNGYEGLLLVAVAAELAWQTARTVGLIWVVVQSVALGAAMAYHWSSIKPALLLAIPYLGFQLLMFAAVRLFVEERKTRLHVAAANERLMTLQAELVDKSRIEERLRIAQDLHDTLGHHLVALGLHLELAAHESQGSARAAVRTAQAMARASLQEVKSIVGRRNEEVAVDFPAEIRRLSADLPQPKLHVDCSPDVDLRDERIGRVLLRTVQEIVTNSIRHGEARNLWIDIGRHEDRVVLAARDDGCGTTNVSEGFGLSGMRRRLEDLGGTLSATPLPAGGFEVRAELPCPEKSAA
jgi:signal transduction histidine kinase